MSAHPSRIARSVKGWRCYVGWHRWKLRSVCSRMYLGGGRWWEVYEECRRCGEVRSYAERNERVADALDDAIPKEYAEDDAA